MKTKIVGPFKIQELTQDGVDITLTFDKETDEILNIVETEGDLEPLISRGVFSRVIWDNIRLKQMGIV